MPWDDIIKTDYGPENLPSDEVNTHGKVIGTQIEAVTRLTGRAWSARRTWSSPPGRA